MNKVQKFLMFIAAIIAIVLLVFLIKNQWNITAAVQDILSFVSKK